MLTSGPGEDRADGGPIPLLPLPQQSSTKNIGFLHLQAPGAQFLQAARYSQSKTSGHITRNLAAPLQLRYRRQNLCITFHFCHSLLSYSGAMGTPPGSLAGAVSRADNQLTVLDDRFDAEDNAAWLWLRAHQLHGHPHHVVIGTDPLPPSLARPHGTTLGQALH